MPMSPGSHTASLFLDFPASKLKSPSDSHALVESQPQWYTVCNQPRDDSPLHLGIYPSWESLTWSIMAEQVVNSFIFL